MYGNIDYQNRHGGLLSALWLIQDWKIIEDRYMDSIISVVDVRVDEKLLREEQREERLSSLRLSRVASELDESQIAAEDETTMSIEEALKMTLLAVREEYAKA